MPLLPGLSGIMIREKCVERTSTAVGGFRHLLVEPSFLGLISERMGCNSREVLPMYRLTDLQILNIILESLQ